MLESLFNKVAGLKVSLLKRDSNTGVFLGNLGNFLKHLFFTEHPRWFLLMFVLSELYFIMRITRKKITALSAITCSKLTIETLEQGVKYIQS